jgi:hypothetical protein
VDEPHKVSDVGRIHREFAFDSFLDQHDSSSRFNEKLESPISLTELAQTPTPIAL